MTDGTHDVVVWVGTKLGEEKLFTLTARNALGNSARLVEVEAQVADAKFVEVRRETNMTKSQAEAKKKEIKSDYIKRGFTYQSRNELPRPMKYEPSTRLGYYLK